MANSSSPGKIAVKMVCVCVCVLRDSHCNIVTAVGTKN